MGLQPAMHRLCCLVLRHSAAARTGAALSCGVENCVGQLRSWSGGVFSAPPAHPLVAGLSLTESEGLGRITPAARFHSSSSSSLGLQPTAAALHGVSQPQSVEERSPQEAAAVDPYVLVQDEVAVVSERLRHSIVSNVPALKQAADYFFRPGVQGKRLRPTLLLLLAGALSSQPPSPEDLLPDLRPPHEPPQELRRRQQRIAEVAELIHVASLMHDDVLDDAETRRGVLSLNAQAGNKLAILAGDFLLARASVTLASLHDTQIVELLSRVLEHLVAGEVMQMTASPEALVSMDHYLRKTFCKTASLMANSARAVALLSEQPEQQQQQQQQGLEEVAEAAWQYGRHLGIAFQIVDDLLDLTGSSSVLGKPALNDMKSGIATAPVLLAAEEQQGLVPIIQRKFKGEGDVALALGLVHSSSGIRRARELAADHARLAAEQVRGLPPAASAHAVLCREALIRVTEKVLTRSK